MSYTSCHMYIMYHKLYKIHKVLFLNYVFNEVSVIDTIKEMPNII